MSSVLVCKSIVIKSIKIFLSITIDSQKSKKLMNDDVHVKKWWKIKTKRENRNKRKTLFRKLIFNSLCFKVLNFLVFEIFNCIKSVEHVLALAPF